MEKVRLGDIASVITKGTTPTTLGYDFVEAGVNFVKIESITENGEFLTDKFAHITEECDRKLSRSQLQRSDLLFSIAGAIGRTAIVTEDILPANTNQALAIIRVPEGIVDYSYLKYVLQSPNIVEQFEKKKQGVAQLNISLKDIGGFLIPMCTTDEQKSIVDTMDKVSELIALRKEQLAKLDQLVKSRFIELFGDPVYNNNGLLTKKLCELGSLDRGRSQHRPRNDPKLLNGPYPLIQTGEVASAGLYITEYKNTYSELGLQQSKMWKAGTLCITIAANIAQTAILTFDACFPDSVVGFVPNDAVSATYMHYWFGFFQKILEEQAPQVAQKNINLKILSDLDVMVPTKEQQEQFAAFVEQTDKSKSAIQQSLDKLELLKKSLMQEYFG